MAKQKLRYQNSFNGGESVDTYLGLKNQIINTRGIDITTNERYIQCGLASQNSYTSTGLGTKLLYVSTYILSFHSDGKIYRDGNLVYTDADGLIKNAIVFNSRVRWVTTNKINNIAVSSIGGTWDGTTVNAGGVGQKTLTNTVQYAPMKIVFNTTLYIGNGNILAEIDSGNNFTGNVFDGMVSDDIVTTMTFGSNYLRIYTAVIDGGNYYKGRQYYWDLVNPNPIDIVEWEYLPVWNAIEYGQYDYVIAGIDDPTRPFFSTGLYLASGYSRQLIRQFNQDYPYTNSQTAYSNFYQRFPLLLDGENLYVGTYGGVYRYGTNKPGFPKSWTLEYLTSAFPGSDNRPDVNIGDIIKSKGNANILYSWIRRTSGPTLTYGVDTVDVSSPLTYNIYSQFDTLPIDGGLALVNKSNIELSIGFYPLNEGEKIEIQSRRNLLDGAYTTLKTIDYSNTIDRSIMKKEIPIVGDWNFIQFRVILTSGTSQLTTPKVFDMALLYDDNIRD